MLLGVNLCVFLSVCPGVCVCLYGCVYVWGCVCESVWVLWLCVCMLFAVSVSVPLGVCVSVCVDECGIVLWVPETVCVSLR